MTNSPDTDLHGSHCPACHHENSPADRFCGACGSALVRRCPSCSSNVSLQARFCEACGQKLQGAATLAARDQEPAFPGGERRQLTVLFCDLVGSTPLSQQIDAEEWRYIIAQYHKAAAGAVERFGGHVAQYLGDGLLIYFGWPTAREDDPERAARAGLAILAAMEPLNSSLEAGGSGARLSVRIGMHTGPVVVTEAGEVFGDTPNIAARVQAAAEPDTVLVSATTQRLVAGIFVVEDRGAQSLKGVRDAVSLYRIVSPSGVRSRLGVAAGRLSHFVGREVELATLIERWERVEDGEGQNVLVFGEPGVGKSRLVYQLHEHLAAVPHTWLECGATPYTEGTPFHPIAALVAQGLAFAPEDTPTDKLARLTAGLRELASDENVALLADFLGLPPPTSLQLSPELQRRKTIDLLAQWNLSLGNTQPLVLLIEDLHWCDASTLELLGQIMAQSPTARVLLLATTRPDFLPPWPPRSNLTTIQLARLTRQQARQMATTLGGPELPPETIEALVARTDGVPLYVEELVKTLSEPGADRGIDAIPATLADSLMARLDGLSTAKEVAQRAAVLGREFTYPLLAATAGLGEAALRHGLERLVEAEILFARGEPPAASYTFKHALIQETAYFSLLKRTRRQFHALIAEALESQFPERVEAEPEVIARHCDEAGAALAASLHYRRAGERATKRSAYEEAITHLRRALALVATLPETRERNEVELSLQMAIGAPLVAVRGISHQENEQAFARARELAARIGESPELARVLAGLSDAYQVRGDLGTASEIAREALVAAEKTGRPYDLLSAHYQLGAPLFFQGEFALALEHFSKSFELYDAHEHGGLAHTIGIDRGVGACGYAAWCQLYLGFPDKALALGNEAVALARRVDHRISLAQALMQSGVIHIVRGEVAATLERADEVIDICERLGFPLWLGIGKIMRGWARARSGSGEAGIDEMQEALSMLAGIGSEIGTPQMLSMLADGLTRIGRHDEALAALDLGSERAMAQEQHYYDAVLSYQRAVTILARKGETADKAAEACLSRSLEIARRQKAGAFELRAARELARLWQRQHRDREARDLLRNVYARFSEGFATEDLVSAKSLLAELETSTVPA